MEYKEQINIRLTKQDKEKISIVLNEINKNTNKKVGYRFLIMEFVNNYLDNNLKGLEIEKNHLLKELDKQKENKNKIVENITELEIKINKIDNELNNKSLLDISNYKYNENITSAYNRLKDIVLSNSIMEFDLLENDIINLENTFKIKEKGLLREIVLNDFNKWQNEILLNQSQEQQKEVNRSEFLEKSSRILLRGFKDKRQHIKDLETYLNKDINKKKIDNLILNSGLDITQKEVINYILSN